MKTNTDRNLVFAKIFLGMFITAIFLSFLVLLAAIVWGIYDPSSLSKYSWKPDLYQIRNYSLWSYLLCSILILSLFILYFLMFYRLIKISAKLNLEKPFDFEISENMLKISIYLTSIFFINYLAETYISGVITDIEFKKTNIYHVNYNFSLDRFYPLVAGAITYVFSLIYKKGLELQSENELTV